MISEPSTASPLLLMVQKSGQPVEVVSLSHYLRWVLYIPSGCWGFLSHQQYVLGVAPHQLGQREVFLEKLLYWGKQKKPTRYGFQNTQKKKKACPR